MFERSTEIVPGMIVRHVDGLTYRVDRLVDSTDGYEAGHSLNGLRRVLYTQLEDGSFPAGKEWDKDSGEFREFFTPVSSPE